MNPLKQARVKTFSKKVVIGTLPDPERGGFMGRAYEVTPDDKEYTVDRSDLHRGEAEKDVIAEAHDDLARKIASR